MPDGDQDDEDDVVFDAKQSHQGNNGSVDQELDDSQSKSAARRAKPLMPFSPSAEEDLPISAIVGWS